MFCTKCGVENSDIHSQCQSCGAPLQQLPGTTTPVKINNWLVPAIIVTALCCLPFGIAGIIFAVQVNGKLQAGDVAGAMKSAQMAKMWTLIGVGVGLLVQGAYITLMIIGAVAGK